MFCVSVGRQSQGRMLRHPATAGRIFAIYRKKWFLKIIKRVETLLINSILTIRYHKSRTHFQNDGYIADIFCLGLKISKQNLKDFSAFNFSTCKADIFNLGFRGQTARYGILWFQSRPAADGMPTEIHISYH